MSRWKVMKNRFCGDWSVYHASPCSAGGVLWERVSQWFDTWREAMDYADRMARTREVTLPRTHTLPTGRHVVQKDGLIAEYVRSQSQPQIKPGHLVVEPWERRPLALALLALAEKEEVERP